MVGTRPIDLGWTLLEKEGQIVVTDLRADSIASLAGLRKGDHIVRINDQVIETTDGIGTLLASERPGSVVLFQVVRGTRTLPIRVTLPAGRVVERALVTHPENSRDEIIHRLEVQEEMLARILAELEAVRAELKARK